ncbi:MAG: cache domain-containing protein [Cocleimonas sp.]|nr:cache domain-containing protein [Cocleimonas sp.]
MFSALPYKIKIALLTLIPLILAISAIAVGTAYQTKQLASKQTQSFENQLIATKKEELKNYMDLAYSAIKGVYENKHVDKKHAQQEVYDTLKNMEFGEDGYYFVYDYSGVNIVHPRKPQLEGKNLFDFQDDNGKFLIRKLIEKAKDGGGYTRYLWDKPSGGKSIEKLSYSIGLEKWHWMIGTGIYIDDIEKGVTAMKEKAKTSTTNTLLLTSMIAIAATLLIALIGFIVNLSEGKLANQKMRDLTHKTVNFQEDERKRVSRELHDGINQLLVSIRYKLDNAKSKILKQSPQDEISHVIDDADEILSTSIQEVRRISRDLRPTLLDDLGLSAAIDSLSSDFSKRNNIEVTTENNCQKQRLPQEVETAFYRIIQEALTNIEKHARNANHVILKIDKMRKRVTLSISNDGLGFDKTTLDQTNPDRGLGLRNMIDRAELLEGHMTVNSAPEKGTTVIVTIPL